MTTETTATPAALHGIRVLDLGGLPSMYASKLLADFGADVILIEGPNGDASRHMPPYAGAEAGTERSLVFHSFHANKRSAAVDITTDEGRNTIRRLAGSVDVILETNSPGYMAEVGLDFESLRATNPGLILCSVTHTGRPAPTPHTRAQTSTPRQWADSCSCRATLTVGPSCRPPFSAIPSREPTPPSAS